MAALEAFHEEADTSRRLRLSSTLPRGTTAGQDRRRYRDPAVVDNKDSVLSQEDPPLGVKKADQQQHTPRTDNPQQTKDKSRKDHLQVPKEALGASSYDQQSTAQDKIYVVVQPMPAPGTVGTPYFTEQNVSQFIK